MNKLFFPEIVQIQTTSFCNADCIICPYKESTKNNPSGYMNLKLFEKIINECSEYKPKIINLFFMNEPLMDKKIIELIKMAKEKNPSSKIDISTNASLLSEEKSIEIINSGLDSITISFHSPEKESYEKIMKGLDFDNTINNVKTFLELNHSNNNKIEVIISMRHLKHYEYKISDFKKLCKEKGAILHEGKLTNRAGLVKNFHNITTKQIPGASHCKRPFGYIGILFDGEVVACCADWYRKKIMGNVSENSIKDVWDNNLYEKLRQNFDKKNYDIDLCKDCELNFTPEGKIYI